MEISNPSSSKSPAGGKVLRLHFACHAELPIGSSLRVTSSTLWAPGSLSSTTDPTDTYAVSMLSTGSTGIVGGYPPSSTSELFNASTQSYLNLYASSMEMVTTPDTYPIWKTKNPIIVVANQAEFQHHRYRYLVVTPGADMDATNGADHYNNVSSGHGAISSMASIKTSESNASNMTADNTHTRATLDTATSTANLDTMEESYPVMLWEDPFQEDEEEEEEGGASGSVSLSASLTGLGEEGSAHGGSSSGLIMENVTRKQTKNLANLPYRTFTITSDSIQQMEQLSLNAAAATTDADADADANQPRYTPDGIRIDTWSNKMDESFQPYFEREQIKKKNSMQSMDTVDTGDTNSDAMDITTPTSGPSLMTSLIHSASTQKKERLFLVCFHLPVIITKDPQTHQWNATWNESLLAKSPNSILEKSHDLYFVGHVSNPQIKHDDDRNQIRQALEPMGCTPLFLDKELIEAHYLGMCKQVLWPAFHNIDLLDLSTSGWGQREHLAPKSGNMSFSSNLNNNNNNNNDTTSNLHSPSSKAYSATNVRSTIDSSWDQSQLDKWWEAYILVNQTFANALAELLQPGDITWVHDYHLALLPSMLDTNERNRHGRRTSKMVFFLHIPFPTSQIFRELECGEALLQGMLHADVVGFHAFDHARHFLNAAKRILGLNYENLVGGLIGVQYRGKKVLITMSNVSIEPYVIDKVIITSPVLEGTQLLKARHENRIIIAGVDIAQRLSGITFKFLAFERLLTDYPIWKDKAVMVQRCLIPGSRRADEANTIREVRFLIRRIQEKFGRRVIDYQEVKGSSLPIEQRLALWNVADCLMLSPVREGLNMIPMEYVYARKAPLTAGVTIASEFSAVCRILNGALRVNPFDIQLTAANIDKALSMEMKEKESRRARDIDFVSNFPKDKWTRNVLRDLDEAARSGDDDDINEEKKQDNEVADMSTAAFLAREHEISFSHVNYAEVTAAYNASSRRVIFLDFNGTIVNQEPPGKYLKRQILGTSGLKPPSSVVKVLNDLVADSRNLVYVVSGDMRENIENAIGDISGLGLASSSGAFYSNPIQVGETRRTWQTFDLGVDWDAVKKVSLPILSKYTARTNGSFVKLAHASIGWSYYSCDPEWGSLQATYLVLELESELRAFDVRFVSLKGVVQIVPRRLNKGLIVKKVLREASVMNGGKGVDFILCMGDDVSDEKMFTSVFSFISKTEDCASIDPTYFPPLQSHADIFSAPLNEHPMGDPSSHDTTTEGNSSNDMYCFTVTVGKKASHATQYVDDARDVANLLITMTGGVLEERRSLSFDANEIEGSELFS